GGALDRQSRSPINSQLAQIVIRHLLQGAEFGEVRSKNLRAKRAILRQPLQRPRRKILDRHRPATQPVIGREPITLLSWLRTEAGSSDLLLALEGFLPIVTEPEELEQVLIFAWRGRQILQPLQAGPGGRPVVFAGKKKLAPFAAAD